MLLLAALLRLLWLDLIPPGWHHDEALMGIMASEVYRGAQRPIFFSGYLGQEPLYIYLSAGMMWLLGGNLDVLPLRLTSAALGIATVLVTYLLGREMFGRRVGLIGASLLAFSFWQVMLSREGYRVIGQPLVEGLAIYLLWKASRRHSTPYYVAAGLAMGGTLYTYLGARLFPGALVLFGVWWVLARGWHRPQARRGLAIFAVVAALTAAPLLFYLLTHPGTFSGRIDQVSVLQPGSSRREAIKLIADNLVRLLTTFVSQGEMLWRYNIAGRPFLTGGVALLGGIGLLTSLWRAVRKDSAYVMALAWLVVMVLPCVLSRDSGQYTLRAMGLAPMLFLLPAVGLVSIWDWVAARTPRIWQPRAQVAFAGLAMALLLIEGGMTYRDYFLTWANSNGAARENMADIEAAARYLEREANPADEDIFISSDIYRHAVIAHLAPDIYAQARWLDGRTALVLSPQTARPAVYAFPASVLPKQLDRYLPPEACSRQSNLPDGTARLVVCRLQPAQVESVVGSILGNPAFTRTEQNLADETELVSYQLDPKVEAGDKLHLTAVWQPLRDSPQNDYVVFVHVQDQKRSVWAQYDGTAFQAREWRAGDIIVEQYDLPIGKHVPAGEYEAVMGVYDRTTLQRVAIKGAATSQDTIALGSVTVTVPGGN